MTLVIFWGRGQIIVYQAFFKILKCAGWQNCRHSKQIWRERYWSNQFLNFKKPLGWFHTLLALKPSEWENFWSSKEDFKTYVVIFNKIFILHFWDEGGKDGKEWITCCTLVSYRIMMLTIARLCLQVIDYWYISQQRATLCLVLKHFLWHYSIPRWIMCDIVTRWCGQIGGANRSEAVPHQIDLDKFNSKKWLCYTE